MATTVTVDKAYFETLLRRAEFHTSGTDLATPVEVLVVNIPKIDHDNLLRLAQEYASLREALYKGGIEPETLEVLLNGKSFPPGPVETFNNKDEPAGGGIEPFGRFHKAQIITLTPAGNLEGDSKSECPPKSNSGGYSFYSKGKGASYSRQGSSTQDNTSYKPDNEKDNLSLGVPGSARQQYAKIEQRTILAKNLSDQTTHKDIATIVRGGTVLDIYLRSGERFASISFVEGAAAHNFLNHTKRNDIYIHGRRLEFCWNDRQFILPRHVANKIRNGATRNLVMRGVHPDITEQRLRNDMEHIHNLVVIGVNFQNGDAYLSLNSIHNALFARTCMLSRAFYKGTKIEWYPDECSQPLPTMQHALKENRRQAAVEKPESTLNRFQMLKMDWGGTEDGFGDEDDEPAVLSALSSLSLNPVSPWSPRNDAV